MAPSTYNISSTTLAGLNPVAYGSGMSEWCANCHGSMHLNTYTSGASLQTSGTNVHPAGNGAKLSAAGIYNNYNAYVTSGIMTGSAATAYTDLVPFETGDSSFTALKALSAGNTTGATTNSNAQCLSCHRAHASGFTSMARYGIDQELVTTGANAYSIGRGATYTTADMQTAYYGRPATVFAAYQRDLCNKCHAKD